MIISRRFTFSMFAIMATAIIVATFMSMPGCKVLQSPAMQPFDAIAVSVAVDTVVGTNPITKASRAAAVKRIATQVLAADTGVMATVDSLAALAGAEVAKLNLPPGDQAAAQLLLAVLDSAANQYIGSLTGGNLDVKNTQVAIGVVCNWVIAEASRLGG